MLKLEFRDNRQVVGSDERRPAFVQERVRQLKVFVEIDMVEMENRQDAGKSARRAEMHFGIDRLEARFEKLGRQPARPFVEIARDDAFADKFRVFENVRGE